MLTGFLIFFFLLGLKEVLMSKTNCPPFSFFRHGRVKCFQGNQSAICGSFLPVGSTAEFTCEQFYRLSSEDGRFLECRLNGSWSSGTPKCVPDCGLRSEFGGLVVNGMIASLKDFPWHVGIYNLVDGSYEYWCGGSLISESIVITAAHCTWGISPSRIMLVFGKFHRDYNYLESTAQKIKAKKIKIPSSFQDVAGNYNGDIAVVFLERKVKLGYYSAPICIDWDQKLTEKHLAAGTSGMVVGWGLTENDTLSEILRTATLPVVSDEKCISEQKQDFKKFVTFTSFCAGLGNGTGVCNGDSGGGFIVRDENSTRWYLQGLVSVSPKRKESPYCDLNFFTIFTKVSVFSKWLKRVIEVEKKISPGRTLEKNIKSSEFFKKYFDQFGEKITFYPHTIKMMELAGLIKPSQKNM